MISRVVRSTALYGRADLVLHLKPFTLAESAQMLPGRGWMEVLEAQMFAGGVPKYLDLLGDAPSVRLAISEQGFTETGYFVEEYQRIFTSHFGENPDFEAIVRALAGRQQGLTRKQIAAATGLSAGGTLSQHLHDLEAAGFVETLRPVDRDRATSRLLKFSLSDAYLRFYFAFIEPHLSTIRAGNDAQIWERVSQTGAFYAWMGLAFENVCRRHATRLSELLGFSGIAFSCGPYFRRPHAQQPGVQIDLVFVRADRVVTLCEMKYSEQAIGVDVIPEVSVRVTELKRIFPGRTIQRVLVTANGATKDLEARGYFYRILTAESLW